MIKRAFDRTHLFKGALSTALLIAIGGCHSVPSQAPAADAPTVLPATAAGPETNPTTGEMEAGKLVLGSADADNPLVIAATGSNGLETFSLDGTSLGSLSAGEVIAVDVAYGFSLGGQSGTLIGAIDQKSDQLRFFSLSGNALSEVGAGNESLPFAAENVCFYRHALDGLLYAFVVGDGGQIDQNLVYETASGRVSIRPMRRINVPSTIKQCVSDPGAGKLYVSEESVGIWQFNADPEAEVGAALLDQPMRGHINEEVGGLAIYDGGEGVRWLLASNLGAGTINVYDLNADGEFAGSLHITNLDGEAMEEPGQLHAISYPVAGHSDGGLLLVADEEKRTVKTIPMSGLADALGLTTGLSVDPRIAQEPTTAPVLATVETVAVKSFGDAADDPVIWANPTNPAASLVIATDKQAGLYVYDMNGQIVQFLPDGKMNNVDLRSGFKLNGDDVTLVTASDRTHRSIALYILDEETGTLRDVSNGPQPTGLDDPYGLCMYRNLETSKTYVFINGDETRKRQWELVDAGNGKVDARLVRDLTFDSQTEGCVVDDRSATLYVGEEDVGIWKLDADPSAGNARTKMDMISDNEYLYDDVEGMSIYSLEKGGGYLIASSQGNNTYAIYDLLTDEYLGSVAVVANPNAGLDGASETDGLDVSAANLGPGFEQGALVVQDGRNVMPSQNQNYKYIPWKAIAAALNLQSN